MLLASYLGNAAACDGALKILREIAHAMDEHVIGCFWRSESDSEPP
jgi:hypothetical protein